MAGFGSPWGSQRHQARVENSKGGRKKKRESCELKAQTGVEQRRSGGQREDKNPIGMRREGRNSTKMEDEVGRNVKAGAHCGGDKGDAAARDSQFGSRTCGSENSDPMEGRSRALSGSLSIDLTTKGSGLRAVERELSESPSTGAAAVDFVSTSSAKLKLKEPKSLGIYPMTGLHPRREERLVWRGPAPV